VTAKSPWNARGFNNLGYALALEHRDADADAAFRQALSLDPSYVRAAVNLKLLRDGALVRHR
jgi:Flp pilus assembly protein TadD